MIVLLNGLRRITGQGISRRIVSSGRLRRAGERCRRLLAVLTGLLVAAGSSLVSVPVVTAAAVAAGGAAAVVTAAPAKATGGLPVLVVDVNGESSAPEAALLTSAGYSVTQVTTSALASDSQTYIQGFAAVVIGDPPSGGACQVDTAHLGSQWEPWITGNIAVLGTDAGLAGSTAAQTLITDTAEYAAAQPAGTSGVSRTGLYLSLEGCYASSGAGTAVSLLNTVANPGQYTDGNAQAATIGGPNGAGGVTVNGGLSCSDSGTVNKWGASAAGTFAGFGSGSLASGANWPSPACPVQEAFDSWPAGFTALAYDAAGDVTQNFTASDGAPGQPYILLGSPQTTNTQGLAPSANGEVPAGATSGGTSNPAAGGVSQALAAGAVNTENGGLTQSVTDVSVPTFGPGLSFSRAYDSGTARQQVQGQTPGPMGYGWTDNWASSLTAARPVAGDIYTLAGLRNADQNGVGPQTAPLGDPGGVAVLSSNLYFADSAGNRIVEVPNSSTTQWGVTMTARNAYMVAGSTGSAAAPAGGTLNHPQGIAFDSSGDMYIADTWDSRIEEIPVTSKTQWGVSMTAGRMYTVAGQANGTSGTGGDGGAPTSAYLNAPASVAFDSSGNMYIADGGNNRVQEIYESGSTWGETMTAGDIYTVAGNASGTSGISGDGGASRYAYLWNPTSVSTDSSGNVYIADSNNNRVQGMAPAAGTLFGVTAAAHGIYTIAGSATGTAGNTGDTGTDTSSLLDGPQDAFVSGGNLYIADALNNRVREIAGTGHTEWGVSMTASHIYGIAGNGTAGYTGDLGAATSAEMNDPLQVALDGGGSLFVADANNNRMRKVNSSTYLITTYAGNGGTSDTIGNSGPATQAALKAPLQEAFDAQGDVYIADAGNNRVQEIAAYTHTQYGIAMTGGDVYTVAGQALGQGGCQCGNPAGPATGTRLNDPWAIAVGPAGDLYIADTGNSEVEEVPAATGTQWGQSMTAGELYGIAGGWHTSGGDGADGSPAVSSYINRPIALLIDPHGNLYFADQANNRIQEIPAATGTQWGQPMTADDMYTVAGNAGGTGGSSGDGGPATSAYLSATGGLALDAGGDLYIGDGGNTRVQELAAATHAQWGQQMTAGDIYTVAGGPTITHWQDGSPASNTQNSAAPSLAIDTSGNLYIADEFNNRIEEVANATGTQWGQSMTAGDEYTVAGSFDRTQGNSGDGGPATTALMANSESVSADPQGDLYITDNANDTVREVASATATVIAPAPGQASPLAIAPAGTAPGGLTVTQPGGAQVTFWPQSGGACTSPYVKSAAGSGSYCVLPESQAASLTYNSGPPATYTFTPAPGADTYTYAAATGAMASETDTAGNTLTITYNSPSPGGSVTTGGGSGVCPTAASSCETITSASGRALILGYNGTSDTGQITSVTDPMNRTWTYGYNTNPLQLTSVTDPMTNVTSYGYDTGNGNPLLVNDLNSITNPNGQAGGPDAGHKTTIVYNTTGQVTSVTDPMGWQTTINYCVSSARGNCLNPATGNGFVTVTDPDGNQTVYSYDQGTIAAQSDWTNNGSGVTLADETDSVPDVTSASATTDPSAGTLLDTAGTDGNSNTTTNSYNTAGSTTSVTSPGADGAAATTTSSYSSALQLDTCDSTAAAASTAACSLDSPPSPVAPGGVITPPSSAPPLGVTYTLYDTDGNQLYTTTGVYEPGGSSAAYSQTTYQLFKNNSITLNGTNITCTNNTPPSLSLPCATINADGVVTQLAYNPEGDLTSSATPDGNSGGELATTTYLYDADGERTSVTAPDGNLTGANAGNYTTVTAYNSDGQKTTLTRAGGTGHTLTARTTTYGYDGDGNQTTVQDARTYTTTTAYNADDEASLVTNPDNNSTLTCYDGDGNVAQIVPAVGVAANSLAPTSCPTSYPAGYSTRLASDATVDTYDGQGDVTVKTTPAPAGQSGYETTTNVYDGNGNVTQTTAPPVSTGGAGVVTVDTYNPDGSRATQTTGYGTSAAATTSYCYDQARHTTAVVAPNGNSSGTAPCETSSPWVVNATSYPTQASYQTTYSYDSAGEQVSTTRPATSAAPSGQTTAITYDPAGNVLTSTDPNSVITTWTYTPLNLAATVSYSGGTAHAVSYGYDASDNRTSMSDATGSSSYVWDAFGELSSAQNGAGQTVSYGYDADGDTTGITYPLPGTHSWAATTTVNYGYDNAGFRNSATDFNNHQITVTPNADGLAATASLGATGDTIANTYDNSDGYTSIALKNASSTLQSFTYSDAPSGNILNETDTPSSSQSPAVYTYDAKGRVTSMTPGTGSTLNYAFDPSTNLTTLPTGASTSYDKAGELTSSTLAGTATSYTYNPAGQRLTATQGGTTIASGTWNGAGQLTAYSDPAANMTAATYDGDGLRATTSGTGSQSFAWNNVSSNPQLVMDSGNAYIYADGVAPAEQVNLSTGSITYLVTDSLGSVRGLVNSAGTLTGTTNYDAWGNPETTGGLSASTPFGYAGGYTDPTGLIYLINRYYDPQTGQFTSLDPLVDRTLAPYAYTGGDPIGRADPNGLCANTADGICPGQTPGATQAAAAEQDAYYAAQTTNSQEQEQEQQAAVRRSKWKYLQEYGRVAEYASAWTLENEGWEIIAKNFYIRVSGGLCDVDILARDESGNYLAVQVKYFGIRSRRWHPGEGARIWRQSRRLGELNREGGIATGKSAKAQELAGDAFDASGMTVRMEIWQGVEGGSIRRVGGGGGSGGSGEPGGEPGGGPRPPLTE
jgi:RHS repeat-associated protein